MYFRIMVVVRLAKLVPRFPPFFVLWFAFSIINAEELLKNREGLGSLIT